MLRTLACLIAALLLLPAGTSAQPSQAPAPCDLIASIGVATMASDGTITMRIRSLPPGPIAEATLVYAPGDPKYEEILQHLGGLTPGASKPVPPWC